MSHPVETDRIAGPSASAPPVNILLVDDQPSNLLALEAILDDLGHNLVRANSGEEALRHFLNSEFAVVLLDVQMHNVDGFETAKLMRSRPGFRHTPIIFLTAYDSDRSTVEQAYALGAVDFITKPLIPVILKAKVAGFVELYLKTQKIKRQAEQLREREHRGFEEKLAEENARLRESEARKAAILNTALDCIITIDHEGKVIEFNPAAERTFGFSRAQALGRELTALIIPHALRDQCRQGLSQIRVSGDGPILNQRIEMPALHADGTEFPVELAVTRISREGPPVFTAYLRDISERRRTERRRSARLAVTQALAQSATLPEAAPRILQAVCESLDWNAGLLWTLDEVEQVLRCTAAWQLPAAPVEKFVRASRQHAFRRGIGLPGRIWDKGVPVWILDVGTDENFPRQSIAREEKLHGAFGFPILHGSRVLGVIEFFSAAVREPDPDLLEMATTLGNQIGQFVERRRAEESLRESEQRFSRFMQHLPGLAWIKDLHGRYVYANDAALKAFRATRELLYGKSDDEVFPAATAATFRENDQRALRSGTDIQVVETLVHDDGTLHHSIVSKFPIWGPDDRVALVGGMAIDITDRLRAEEALKEADRHKDEFLAMLAHELRNPLAPVQNALQIMKLAPANAELVGQSRDMIDRQVSHLVRLVDDLLDVGRIVRKRIELRKEPLDLASVLRQGIETAQPAIDAQRHQLEVVWPAQPISLEGDPVRLAQVVSNLLLNAAKYTETAGRILLAAERDGASAVIRVRDTGIGIDPALLPRIFDLFTQSDRSLARSQGGLGIGLTLVKHLIELHGGTVLAASEGPGKGCEFTVRLPALDAQPLVAADPLAPKLEPAGNSCHRILVVDDNQDAVESTALVLRLSGHEVATAHDGPSALDAVRAFQPRVVLLDIGLPGMSGYDVARQLRARPECQSLVLIAVTGYGQEKDRRQTHEAGFNEHLVKPVDQQVLADFLNSL
jgi:PAS domain S-box-containing protein